MNHRYLISLVFIFFSLPLLADSHTPPEWYLEHIQQMSRDGGRWIASNEDYRSEQEPLDAYGVEWQPVGNGIGMTGRLFGLQDDNEVGEYWRFRVYWDAAEETARIQQFSGNGTVGTGTMVGFGDAYLSEQVFTQPNGDQARDLHHVWFEDDGNAHVTRSLRWQDGAWVQNREYRWRLSPTDS